LLEIGVTGSPLLPLFVGVSVASLRLGVILVVPLDEIYQALYAINNSAWAATIADLFPFSTRHCYNRQGSFLVKRLPPRFCIVWDTIPLSFAARK